MEKLGIISERSLLTSCVHVPAWIIRRVDRSFQLSSIALPEAFPLRQLLQILHLPSSASISPPLHKESKGRAYILSTPLPPLPFIPPNMCKFS